MKLEHTVYLAGPISGCTFGECVDWREEAIRQLAPEIIGLSPMRGKHYLAELKQIDGSYPEHVLSCDRGIISRDYNDCRRCDAVLVNLVGAKKVSIGTIMEIAWAKAHSVPLVVAMEKEGNPHDYCMIRECINFRVETLQEAIDVTKVVLLPAPHRKP